MKNLETTDGLKIGDILGYGDLVRPRKFKIKNISSKTLVEVDEVNGGHAGKNPIGIFFKLNIEPRGHPIAKCFRLDKLERVKFNLDK